MDEGSALEQGFVLGSYFIFMASASFSFTYVDLRKKFSYSKLKIRWRDDERNFKVNTQF